MYVTICMRLYVADRFLENRGVWDNMYETIYTTLCNNLPNWIDSPYALRRTPLPVSSGKPGYLKLSRKG